MNKIVLGVVIIIILIIGTVSAISVTGRVFWSNMFKERSLSPEKIVDENRDDSDKERFNILRLDENINGKERRIIDSLRKAEAKR